MGDFKMGSKTVMSQSGTSNPTWGANAPTGCIVQAVNHKQGSGTALAANSTDWKGTGFGKSITLSSTSHKVLILVSVNGYQGTAGQYYSFNLYRHTAAFTENGSVSGTQLFNDGKGFGTIYGNSGDRFANVSASFIDIFLS